MNTYTPEDLERLAGGKVVSFHGKSDWSDPEPLDAGRVAMPFPLELLPMAIREASEEVARFVKVPCEAPALCGLSAVATAIGKRAIIEERKGLAHFPAMFLVGIAASGERKSPAFKLMTHPLEDWTDHRAESWKEEESKARTRNGVVDNAIQVAKRKAKTIHDIDAVSAMIEELEKKRVQVPAYPRLFTTDATEQRVFQLMHERQGAFSVMSGEGRPVLDSIMGKYSGQGRTGDAIYLAGISGDTITRDRVGGDEGPEARVIRNPCLNVCVMVQPDKYMEAASNESLRASGALARIWPVIMPTLVGTRIEDPGEEGLNKSALAAYNALIFRLLNEEPELDEEGRQIPHRVALSNEASEARRVFHNEVELMMAESGDLEDCKDIASKAVSQTCKLALCIHLAREHDALDKTDSEIGRETWGVAQSIGAWCLSEAVRIQRMADDSRLIPDAKNVVRWLIKTKRRTVTSSVLTQFSPRPRPKAKQAQEILHLLEEFGYLREESKPQARLPVYLIHPEISRFSQADPDREK